MRPDADPRHESSCATEKGDALDVEKTFVGPENASISG